MLIGSSLDKDDKEEKEKDVIIITNNKEIIEPKEGNETDREEHESKENEADINSIKSKLNILYFMVTI